MVDKNLQERMNKMLQLSREEGEETYQCPKCMDRGYTFQEDKDGYTVAIPCECLEKRQILDKLERSGLTESFKRKTFNSYTIENEYQKKAKLQAISFCKRFQEEKGSLLLSGQVGAGKTHLGVATMLQLLKQNVGCKYVEYVSFIMDLKRCSMDETNYNREMNKYKDCTVLFIDDLLKGQTSEADKKYIYELINYRYMRQKPIIVSTEKTIDQLMDYDAAIASRIIEMCKDNIIEFKNVPNRRLKEVK